MPPVNRCENVGSKPIAPFSKVHPCMADVTIGVQSFLRLLRVVLSHSQTTEFGHKRASRSRLSIGGSIMLATRGVDRTRGPASQWQQDGLSQPQRRLLHWSNHEPLPMDCRTRTDWNRLSGSRLVLLPLGSELQLLHSTGTVEEGRGRTKDQGNRRGIRTTASTRRRIRGRAAPIRTSTGRAGTPARRKRCCDKGIARQTSRLAPTSTGSQSPARALASRHRRQATRWG